MLVEHRDLWYRILAAKYEVEDGIVNNEEIKVFECWKDGLSVRKRNRKIVKP